MLDKYLDRLLYSSLFDGFDFETLKGMKGCLDLSLNQYEKGQNIVYRGDDFTKIGIVANGGATVLKENALGARNIVELLTVGAVFGEMAAFSKKAVWNFTVQANQNSKIIFIPKGRILGECQRLCPCHRRLIENFLTILSDRGLFLDKKIEYLTIKSVIGKISAYLYDQYLSHEKTSFELGLNRSELADFLCVSRPTLSREMAALRYKGIIDFYLNHIKIKDIEALKEYLIN